MKILLSAYACHPLRGSEPGVGWGWLKEISRLHQVWVLFYSGQGQREALQEAIASLEYRENIHLLPLGVPGPLQNRRYRIRYELWQWKAYQTAKRLLREVKIDVIHHVTIAAWWNCGHLWKLERPFVFGPISGAQAIPFRAFGFLRWRDRLFETFRVVFIEVGWRFWRRSRRALREADLVVVSNPETLKKVKVIRGERPVCFLTEVGVDSVQSDINEQPASGSPNYLRLFWSGRLIPGKNFGLLLEALRQLAPDVQWHLRVAGDGSMYSHWRGKVQKLGLDKRIDFLKQVDYAKMKEQYRWANVFIFPSLREATGTVVLEAMAYGLPIVALKINGASEVLDPGCAILVPVTSKDQMTRDFAQALAELAKDPVLRRRMGQAALQKIQREYLWPVRARRMSEIYKSLIDEEDQSTRC